MQITRFTDVSIQSITDHSHSAVVVVVVVVAVYCSRLLGMLAQNTNFGSDSIPRVNTSDILGRLLHSARHDLGCY